eukprot:sb/3475405/
MIVRASGYSNIATLLKTNKFAGNSHIQEIVGQCERCLLGADPAAFVRSAAVQVLASFIEVQERGVLYGMERETLMIYRLLKRVSTEDGDEGVRLKALQTLGVLSDIVKGFMFPKQRITRDVKILEHF